MTKLVKVFAVLALMFGAIAVTSGAAQARHWHHHHHGWSGGGISFGFGAYPYGASYGPPVYYAAPACRWERVRVWRHGRWHYRSVRRCW